MYYDRPGVENPVNVRTVGLALAVHAAIVVFFLFMGWALTRTPDVVIPIDMTIVPPWAEQTDDPEPDYRPPPPPQPKVAEPPKPVVEEPPKDDPKVEAVEKIVEKPKPKKPEIKKGEFKKNATLHKAPKVETPDFRKTNKLIKAPMTDYGKATARDKPLSAAEIQKALAMGARFGNSNQLANNEEQRCYSLIQRRFYECWTGFTWSEGLQGVYLWVKFGSGGRIVGYRIERSSGDAAVDQSVLAAAKRAGYVSGLSPDFLRAHEEIVFEMKPLRGN